MDSEWEMQMLKSGELGENENLQESYVAAVSNSDPHKEITKSTVQLLCSFETIFIVPEFVYKKYFTFKYYEQYISCKT